MTLTDKMKDWETYKFASSKNDLKPTLAYHNFSDRERLDLTLMSDEHMGSKFYKEDEHREIVEWCYDNNAPLILLGDELETATKTSVGAGIYEQDEILEKQLEHFYNVYRPLAEKNLILGIHPGNHELRIYQTSGLNITKMMAKELKIPYLGWGKLHLFRVGKESYTLYTTHGSSGATMAHTKIKTSINLANLVEAEIYAHAHLHQLSHHIRNYYEIDKRSRTVKEVQKHFLLTGSYLSHWGSYGHVKSYEPMKIGSPKLKLSGEKHQIRVSM